MSSIFSKYNLEQKPSLKKGDCRNQGSCSRGGAEDKHTNKNQR